MPNFPPLMSTRPEMDSQEIGGKEVCIFVIHQIRADGAVSPPLTCCCGRLHFGWTKMMFLMNIFRPVGTRVGTSIPNIFHVLLHLWPFILPQLIWNIRIIAVCCSSLFFPHDSSENNFPFLVGIFGSFASLLFNTGQACWIAFPKPLRMSC